MTDLLIGMAGSGFHGSNGTASSNGDVVFRTRNPGIYRNSEMRHSRSEDILGGSGPGAPTRTPSPLLHEQTCASEDDLVASSALRDASSTSSLLQGGHSFCPYNGRATASPPPNFATDRIDPEDSIRDIVSENDLYRYVLFKRHYDKYIALSEKYEESRGITYYLEERYHEVKAERDRLEETRKALEKRLEGRETELRDKEEELFLHLERSLRLDDEIERLKAERDACIVAREQLEREQTSALRQLQLQATQSEITRRNLERARQDVVRQATVIRAERDALERENVVLKEKLRVERVELGAERRRREEGIAVLTHEAATLRHAARHLRAAALHATSCRRRRRCSVCLYAKRTFAEADDYHDDGKLFKCLQAPLQDLRTWLRPGPLPSASSSSGLRTSSPMDRGISYIDDSSSSSEDEEFADTPMAEVSLSSTNSGVPPASRAFSSDSGYVPDPMTSIGATPITPTSSPIEPDFSSCSFSSEIGDRRSRSYEPGGSSRKISESSSSEADAQRTAATFTRSKWTSSFRRLLGKKSKAKHNENKA
ncbi:uncharacterized protein LOC107048540 isoform X1 [Diachasma alloeum]|uniref:uncharacterized protein LOC107048540 isoform X1 n=1 Tax=Diachasma alloeum TaxID=454923 RepID=UPI000738495E|nr:uncharacterized protein LOC107048540 isoform X1 [Diachasma alloeum]